MREDSSGRPIVGAEVLLEGTKHAALTGADGSYRLDELPSGQRVALFRAIGFRAVRLHVLLVKGDTLHADASLVSSATQLDPIMVTGRTPAPRGLGVEAFEERRRLGLGKFIDSTELRRNEHLHLADLLQRIPGIELANGSISSARIHAPDGTKCPMQVFYDGNPIPLPVNLGLFDVASLVAVEVYRGPSEIPTEFGGLRAQCGVLVLWTRRGWR